MEAVLQGRRLIVYRPAPDFFVADSSLGHRLNPSYPTHGPRGWRNEIAADHADIVVIGDSQTYGLGVRVDEAFPQKLGERLGVTTIQLAAPGYSPAHYIPLLNEASSYRPRILLAVLYFGNDLSGSYAFAYRTDEYKRVVENPTLDSLMTQEPRMKAALQLAEGIDPRFLRSRYVDCSSPSWFPDARLQQVGDILHSIPLDAVTQSPKPIAHRVVERSALAAGMRRFLLVLTPRIGYGGAISGYGPPVCISYAKDGTRTVFAAAYRLIAEDFSDPRIAEGMRIGLPSLKYLNDKCHALACALYVVMLPTKETAYSAAAAGLADEPYLGRLWDAEKLAREEAQAFFDKHHIRVIDTLAALQTSIVKGINPFPSDADGHLAVAGHQIVADTIAATLKGDGLLGDPRRQHHVR